MLEPKKRYAVFSLHEDKSRKGKGTIWTRAGSAWVNKDGSMNLYLDVLPIEGRLHVREAGERAEATPERTGTFSQENSPATPYTPEPPYAQGGAYAQVAGYAQGTGYARESGYPAEAGVESAGVPQ